MITYTYTVLLCLLFLSVISDLKGSKIRNIYVLSAMLLGITINAYFYGFAGIKSSIIGMVVPILFLCIFFYARLLGAGDIKLFSAIGALLGWKFVLYAISFSFIFGGLYAFVSLARSSEIKITFKDFYLDMKMCLLTSDISYFQNRSSKHIIRLSPAIAMGVCLQMLLYLF
ncbi:MAG: A24 family peptidase [Ruminiclostridium sp.]